MEQEELVVGEEEEVGMLKGLLSACLFRNREDDQPTPPQKEGAAQLQV